MKYSEIKDLTVEELRKRNDGLLDDMFQLKMKHSLGQVANPLSIRVLRKDISRIKTALNKKLSK